MFYLSLVLDFEQRGRLASALTLSFMFWLSLVLDCEQRGLWLLLNQYFVVVVFRGNMCMTTLSVKEQSFTYSFLGQTVGKGSLSNEVEQFSSLRFGLTPPGS